MKTGTEPAIDVRLLEQRLRVSRGPGVRVLAVDPIDTYIHFGSQKVFTVKKVFEFFIDSVVFDE